MLNSILSTSQAASVAAEEFLLCLLASLVFGAAIAWINGWQNHSTRNFTMTVALLPAIVQTVIMLVNGNLGTGVAIMGAFSLVRFRSVPGNGREIIGIFLAMSVGLATGMGYLGVAAILVIVVGVMTLIMLRLPECGGDAGEKELKITIPENLDYNGIFDDLFAKYTVRAQLQRVRTVNMGSLYELKYYIRLRDEKMEKEFLDQIRCRNGNLTVVCGRIVPCREEL
ncbi:MAG: DUF4956 domain-containing protein [Clostridiales bacterium]|nr:DUF4956 domain-containing protein [Clostridiales bacterium]MCD8224626.1 DUF4956 domain-containing protein [Clostridiales bacterium]